MTKMDECLFYHHMDLPGFGDVGKGWDLREMSGAGKGFLDDFKDPGAP